jgi:hypothetical protein
VGCEFDNYDNDNNDGHLVVNVIISNIISTTSLVSTTFSVSISWIQGMAPELVVW